MNHLTLKSPKIKPFPTKNNSKSPSKTTAKSPLRSSSPSPKKKIIKQDEDILTERMSKLREKICGTLDAYVLIFRTDSPMRCLEHNSVLSLYCETEQKLLCANCVYKNGNHKMHKVYPIEKCYQQIARDVDLNSKRSDREVSWVTNSIKAIHNYLENEEKSANAVILSLARRYDELQSELIHSFEEARRNILLSVEEIKTKKESLLLELEFFKETILHNKPLDWQKFENVENLKGMSGENRLIFDHLIGNAIIEYGKYENTKIGYDESKISIIGQKEINRVHQLINILQTNKLTFAENIKENI